MADLVHQPFQGKLHITSPMALTDFTPLDKPVRNTIGSSLSKHLNKYKSEEWRSQIQVSTRIYRSTLSLQYPSSLLFLTGCIEGS